MGYALNPVSYTHLDVYKRQTHDDEIAQVADRILVIEDGQVVDFR